MPVLFARYRVDDLAAWKTAFEANAANRRDYGLTARAVYRDATYSNGVIVIYDAEDLERAHDFYHSDAQRERMAASGMKRAPEFWMGTDLDG
jgi:hypothetical protein